MTITIPRPPEGSALPSARSALNAAAVIVAGLYFGRELLVPMVLAVLLAFVLVPLVALLVRARIGQAPAVLLTVALAVSVIAGIGFTVGTQATSLAAGLPAYQATIQDKVRSFSVLTDAVQRLSESVRLMLGGAREGGAAVVEPAADGGASTLVIVRAVVQPLFGPLATLGVVVVFVIFVLLYREDLRDRLVRLVGRRDLHRTILALNDAARRLSRYFLFQLMLNAGFGAVIGGLLAVVGLPSPVLWGILAATMRFIPFIGSAIAVLPPLLLALAVAPGWTLAIEVLAMFIVTDLVVSQLVEPLLYGHSTGLSPIAIIISTAVWAFLWGPVGLLLATPLTVCLVVIGRHVEPLAFLEVMLGDQPPLEPAETFYQRALEGNAKELAAQARRTLGTRPLAEYYDDVVMRGLELAQGDLARETLAFERLEAIHQQVDAVLAAVAADRPTPAAPATAPVWGTPGAVVCIPARGQLDDLSAEMAMQTLQDAGFGARLQPNAVLGAGRTDDGALSEARMCCLCVLDHDSSASGLRYLLRRIQRRMPGAAVVVCLWHADASSPLLNALRAEDQEETIVLSLSELVALVKAVSARAPQSPVARNIAAEPA